MKIALFSTNDFERGFFDQANKAFGHAIVYHKERLHAATAPMAAGCDAVCGFVNDTFDAPTLNILGDNGVRLVSLRSAGFNNVDLEAAAKANVLVMRVPAYSPESVAEHAVALMLALNRNIPRAYNRVREGNFDLNGLIGFNMCGKIVGIVGTGKIGAALAHIMKGFGCSLLGYDIEPNQACESLGLRYVSFDELLRQSDIISLHCALTPQTTHMFNAKTIAEMKQGSMLINAARGGLIDTKAAIEALKTRRTLAYLGIDVYEGEGPLFFADRSTTIIEDDVFERLTTFPNVLVTGHQAFLTREALTQIAEIALGNARDFEAGRPKRENVVTG